MRFCNFLCKFCRLLFAIVSMFIWLRDAVVSGGEHVDVVIGAAVADGKVTPKVQSLIKILLKYQDTDDFRAIVFVERVVAALVLPKVDHFELIDFFCLDSSQSFSSFISLSCQLCRSFQSFLPLDLSNQQV